MTRQLFSSAIPVAAAASIAAICSFGHATQPAAGPDLTIEDAKVTSIHGNRVDFCYVIRNLGDIPVDLDGVRVTAILSQNQVPDDDDSTLASQPLDTVIKPGGSMLCCCTGLAAIDPAEHGYLILILDPDGKIAESDKTNNSTVVEVRTAHLNVEPPSEPVTTVVRDHHPATSIVVKPSPPPTIYFEPPLPPTLVFLPPTAIEPRVIRIGEPVGPQTIVVGGTTHHVTLPESLIGSQPPCIHLPIPKHSSIRAEETPSILNGEAD